MDTPPDPTKVDPRSQIYPELRSSGTKGNIAESAA